MMAAIAAAKARRRMLFLVEVAAADAAFVDDGDLVTEEVAPRWEGRGTAHGCRGVRSREARADKVCGVEGKVRSR